MPHTETAPAPLRIAFVGYNERVGAEQFRQFAFDNAEQIRTAKFVTGKIELLDGTIIKRVTPYNVVLDGMRFDQIILAVDGVGMLLTRQYELLRLLDYRCSQSCVPEQFRFLLYYTDEPREADMLGRTRDAYGRFTV